MITLITKHGITTSDHPHLIENYTNILATSARNPPLTFKANVAPKLVVPGIGF